MNDSLFKQFSTRESHAAAATDTESEAADDFGAFSILRGVRERALMLELRKKDGSVTALGYGWLEKVEFDPSDGLTLHFGSQKVKIVGRNLGDEARPNVRLLDGLVRHRIPWIREANETEVLLVSTTAIIVEEISIP